MSEINMGRLRALVQRIAIAEASYGCGFYGEDAWNEPYNELLAIFGYDDKWQSTVGADLHAKRWAP
jgi:hypothetical protein